MGMDGERILRRSRSWFGVLPLAAASFVAVGLSGCGDDTEYENKLRPPSPINVTAAISDSAISLSPSSLGAGPIVIFVSNQSDASQVATIEVEENQSNPARPKKASQRQFTDPINPQDTAQIKLVVEPDTTYTLRTDDDRIDAAQLRVGDERPSSQNDVLTP